MKVIGLLGGMSWESTALYYRLINQRVRERLGGFHSARIAMVSVDFHGISEMISQARWETAGDVLAEAARRVQAAGADFLLVCTNTMHKVAPRIEEAISIPLIHLADATAESVKERGLATVGLLGTRATMEEDFYRGRLEKRHGLEVLIPPEEDRGLVHRVIFEELCLGVTREESRREFVRIVGELRDRGAEGVIQGCTEIVMLLDQDDTDVPLFDTTAIHVEAAVRASLG